MKSFFLCLLVAAVVGQVTVYDTDNDSTNFDGSGNSASQGNSKWASIVVDVKIKVSVTLYTVLLSLGGYNGCGQLEAAFVYKSGTFSGASHSEFTQINIVSLESTMPTSFSSSQSRQSRFEISPLSLTAGIYGFEFAVRCTTGQISIGSHGSVIEASDQYMVLANGIESGTAQMFVRRYTTLWNLDSVYGPYSYTYAYGFDQTVRIDPTPPTLQPTLEPTAEADCPTHLDTVGYMGSSCAVGPADTCNRVCSGSGCTMYAISGSPGVNLCATTANLGLFGDDEINYLNANYGVDLCSSTISGMLTNACIFP